MRSLISVLFLALTVLVSPVVSTQTAHAAPTGDIVGTVLSDPGTASTQVVVDAVAVGDPQEQTVATTYTDGVGDFRLGALPPGDYRVRIHGQGVESRWFPGQVTVVANEDVSVGTITVPQPGNMSGQIWDRRTGGLWPVTVRLHRVRDGVTDAEPTATSTTGYGNTYNRDDDGGFGAGPLVPGEYRMHLTDTRGNHATQWYGGFATPEQSPVLTVAAGESTWLKVRYMESGGTVTVPVLAPDGTQTGYPVVRPWVREGGEWVQRGWVDHVSAGTVRIQGFGGGSFRLQVLADREINALETWYGGGATLAQAADITSPFGEDVTVPALHTRAGGIVAGTVRTTAGAPAAAVPVSAWQRDAQGVWTRVDQTSSDDTGAFSLRALPGGDYQVRVGGSDPWTVHRYDDVQVTEGATTDLGDVAAYRASGLSGKVLDAQGNRIGMVEVEAWQQDGGDGDVWRKVETAWADTNGNYAFTHLEPGEVKLHLRTHVAGFAGEWMGDEALDLDSAQPVTLAPEERRLNVNHVLVPRPFLVGTVSSDGGPLGGADVQVLHQTPTGLELINTQTTDAQGRYSAVVPEVGRYAVHVTAPGHSDAWYGGTDAASARRVAVITSDLARADVQVSRLPRVGGTVLHPDGVPFGDRADLELWRLEAGEWTLATTTWTTNGTFALPAVEPGTYAVRAADHADSYLARWYPDVADRDEATLFQLGYGESRNVSITLGAHGELTTSVPFTIGGPTEIGDTMQVTSAQEWNAMPDSVTYTWLRDGEDTLDGYQHTIASNDVLTEMSVLVVARKAGWKSYRAVTDPVLVPGLTPTTGWKVTGRPKVGRTLRLVAGEWAARPFVVTYTWLRNGKKLDLAPRATSYRLTKKDRGTRITVRVRAKRWGYPTSTFTVGKPLTIR